MKPINNLWPAAFYNLFATNTGENNKREDLIFSIKASFIVKVLFAYLAIKQLISKRHVYTN